MAKLETFRDLFVWQKAHELVLIIYKVTAVFPTSEQFGLTSQVRRAAVSVTSNIAEGFSRKGLKEKTQFYYMARGSLAELESQIQIALDLKYLRREDFESIINLIQESGKLLTSLIRSTQDRAKS